MSAHPEDVERFEELRERVVNMQACLQDCVNRVLAAHKDLDLARNAHGKAVRDYLDFKPVVQP